MYIPEWLPTGRLITVPGRGEVFVRVQQHANAQAPVVMLLHGWTASCDTQFLYAYQQLAEVYTVVGVDHHGHGRGLRSDEPFDLQRVADDAAFVLESLGLSRVVAVGYSMGGPIGMYLAQRHPDAVRGLVLQATALDWQSTRLERMRWRFVPLMSPLTRSWWFSRSLGRGIRLVARRNKGIRPMLPWLVGEIRRNDPATVTSAGRALSRHDARPWASTLSVPAASVITKRDRLVRPRKQRALANAVSARIFDVAAGHLAALSHPVEFSNATRKAVDDVVRRSGGC